MECSVGIDYEYRRTTGTAREQEGAWFEATLLRPLSLGDQEDEKMEKRGIIDLLKIYNCTCALMQRIQKQKDHKEHKSESKRKRAKTDERERENGATKQMINVSNAS